MGLPAGQQRVLDTIEEALGTADPRLATMYAIFTRLTGNEARPYREQLPFARGWRSWPTRMRYALSRRGSRTTRRREPAAEPSGILRVRAGLRLPRLLMLGQLVAVVLVVGLLIGISATMRPASCTSASGVRQTSVRAAAPATCRSLVSDGK
jgi:hypothetical protein